MSSDNDKAIVHRFFEDVWNRNSAAAAKELVHAHYSSIENLVFASTPGPQIVADGKVSAHRFLWPHKPLSP